MPRIELNNGVLMPSAGFGTHLLDAGSCERAVSEALLAGSRLVEAATTTCEEGMGRAVACCGTSRDELFVTCGLPEGSAGRDDALRRFDESLERTGLDYLDLFLADAPRPGTWGAWRALEELYQEGVVRALGVRGASADELEGLLDECAVPPAVALAGPEGAVTGLPGKVAPLVREARGALRVLGAR